MNFLLWLTLQLGVIAKSGREITPEIIEATAAEYREP